MNQLKGLFGLICVALLSASCVTIDGQLDVKEAMTAKKKSGFLNLKTTLVTVQPSLYSAHFKMNGDKSYTLKLEGRDNLSIPIKSKNNLNVPSNGRVAISHNDIDQPFDMTGEISTDVSESQRIDTIETCSWTVTENHCQKICDKPDHCDIVCKDVQVTLNGHHEVSFHDETIRRDLSVSFLKQDSSEIMASFRGDDTEVNRITDFSGVCR